MSKLQNMRIVEIPAFRAVSSGPRTLGEIFGPENTFSAWVDAHRALLRAPLYEPEEFLWHENRDINTSVWALAVRDGVTARDTAPYELIDFPGGLFLVATGDESDSADLEETVSGMMQWIEKSDVFEYGDFPASGMCNMPNPDGRGDRLMGVSQQQVFLPLKPRGNKGAE